MLRRRRLSGLWCPPPRGFRPRPARTAPCRARRAPGERRGRRGPALPPAPGPRPARDQDGVLPIGSGTLRAIHPGSQSSSQQSSISSRHISIASRMFALASSIVSPWLSNSGGAVHGRFVPELFIRSQKNLGLVRLHGNIPQDVDLRASHEPPSTPCSRQEAFARAYRTRISTAPAGESNSLPTTIRYTPHS